MKASFLPFLKANFKVSMILLAPSSSLGNTDLPRIDAASHVRPHITKNTQLDVFILLINNIFLQQCYLMLH